MSQKPMMRLQTPDAHARRQAIREQLSNKVQELALQNEQLDKDIEELGLGDVVKKAKKKVVSTGKAAINKITGKDDKPKEAPHPRGPGGTVAPSSKKSDFDEKKHPRGDDGKFAKSSGKKGTELREVSKGKYVLVDLDEEDRKKKEADEKAGKAASELQQIEKEINFTEVKPKDKCGKVNGEKVCGSAFSATTKDGRKVWMYESDGTNKVTRKTKVEMLKTLVDLHNEYPDMKNAGTKIRLYKDLGSSTAGQVHQNHRDVIQVSAKSHESSNETDHLHTIAHEFGHLYDFEHNSRTIAHIYANPEHKSLWNNPNLKDEFPKRLYASKGTLGGSYARANPTEGYAEVFADWHLSKGKTTNVASNAYARHEGWVGAKKGTKFDAITHTFSTQDFELESEDDFIISDDFKNGPRFIGKPPALEDPSSEVQEAADKIVKEVFEELGLPYKD